MSGLAKHRYFLDFTLSALLRRKAKNLSLTVVYSMVIFVLTSVLFFSDAIRKEAETILQEAPEMVVQRTMAGRHELIPLDYLSTVRGIRGVRKAEARLWGYYYHPASKANYTVMATSAYPLEEDQVIAGEGVLRTWKDVQGNSLLFKTFEGTVVRFSVLDRFDTDTALVSSDLILMSASSFRRVFGVPAGVATDLTVEIRNPNECITIAEKVIGLLPDTRPVLREEIQRTYASLFDWRSGYVIVLLAGAVLAFLIFAWDKATGLTADEKAEIGILKAVGWDISDVLMLKFWEGVVICMTAFLLGTAAAYGHVFLADAPLFEHALKGWAVLYPSFSLTPSVDLYDMAAVVILIVLPYALITIVPAWRAATIDPDTVMH